MCVSTILGACSSELPSAADAIGTPCSANHAAAPMPPWMTSRRRMDLPRMLTRSSIPSIATSYVGHHGGTAGVEAAIARSVYHGIHSRTTGQRGTMAVTVEALGSRSDAVYDALKASILEGELGAGARLREEEIAERLGVSRTPVREALGRLEAEGLLVAG